MYVHDLKDTETGYVHPTTIKQDRHKTGIYINKHVVVQSNRSTDNVAITRTRDGVILTVQKGTKQRWQTDLGLYGNMLTQYLRVIEVREAAS